MSELKESMPSVFGKDTKRRELINVLFFYLYVDLTVENSISFLEFTFNLWKN
jgi:hypothetical protein